MKKLNILKIEQLLMIVDKNVINFKQTVMFIKIISQYKIKCNTMLKKYKNFLQIAFVSNLKSWYHIKMGANFRILGAFFYKGLHLN